jgi:formamidopyrimidine-DNA glycosylase
MPELPEVETIARGVHARVRGDRIVEAWFGGHREPFKTPPGGRARGLRDAFFWPCIAPENTLFASWGGIGGIAVCGSLLDESGGKNRCPMDRASGHDGAAAGDHARRSRGRPYARAPDPGQRPGVAICGSAPVWTAGVSRPGPQRGIQRDGRGAAAIGAEEFAALFRGRRLAIKAALLNQKLLAGVGNIYADESLFRAGIRPGKRAGRLTRAELERLRLGLRQVLEQAIRLGGSSVSDYVDADGVRGFFQLEHCVYQRTGQPCLRCKTPIRRIVVGGRGTHYCPHCQR